MHDNEQWFCYRFLYLQSCLQSEATETYTNTLTWLLLLTAALLSLKDANRTEVRLKSFVSLFSPPLLFLLYAEMVNIAPSFSSLRKVTTKAGSSGRQSKYIISLLLMAWTCENPGTLLLLFHVIITCTWRYTLGHYWLHWSWNTEIAQRSVYTMYIPLCCTLTSSYL